MCNLISVSLAAQKLLNLVLFCAIVTKSVPNAWDMQRTNQCNRVTYALTHWLAAAAATHKASANPRFVHCHVRYRERYGTSLHDCLD
jgi:hypothetical protein